MKLEQIEIDAGPSLRSAQLNGISNALTFVYGEKATGKSAVRRFFQNLLFGRHGDLAVGTNAGVGRSRVNLVGQRFELQRRAGDGNALSIQALDGYQPAAPITQADLTANVSASVYDTVFNFSCRDTRSNAGRLATVLHRELGVDIGIQAAGDDFGVARHQQDSETFRSQLVAVEAKMASLKNERADILRLETNQLDFQRQLAALDSLIATTQTRISELGSSPSIDQLSRIDAEIQSLRLRIDNAPTEVIYPVVEKQTEDTSLYNRLDELENQIRRWRNVQSDVQNQRVRLRDEMLVWNEMTLESNEHPYHNAREILVALESKVDQAERSAKHWASVDNSSRIDTDQLAGSLGDLCQHMRDDLYRLCNELSHQYKHLRHKSAATELKQLRRCYTEMGENIDRLVQRRAGLIKEIQLYDPAGADLIVRADSKFCQCAQHEGYLEARKRFVGPVANTVSQPVRIEPDLSHERNRLASLEAERAAMLSRQGRFDTELNDLNRQLTDQLRQRDDLVNRLIAFDQTRVSSIDAELSRLEDQRRVIHVQQNSRPQTVAKDPILSRAASWLPRLTAGAYVRVYLAKTAHSDLLQLEVQAANGQVIAFDRLQPSIQDQVYLCLVLSAKEQLQATFGVELPTMIDDVFVHVENDKINPTVDLLTDFVRQGHQLILFSQHRYLADRFPEARVLELNSTLVSTPTVARPRETRTSHDQIHRVIKPTTDGLANLREEVSRAQVNQNRTAPYPLSKYKRNDDVLLGSRPRIYSEPAAIPRADGRIHTSQASYRAPASQQYSALPVQEFAEQIHLSPAVDERTQLVDIRLFSADDLRFFKDHRIVTAADLFRINEDRAEGIGIALEQVEAWQSELWLLSTIPGIKDVEARLLVAAGINGPEELIGLSVQAFIERIHRYKQMNNGRSGGIADSIDFERVSSLQRNASRSRDRWQHRQRPYFVARSTRPRGEYSSNGQSRSKQPLRSERSSRDQTGVPRPSRPVRDSQRREYRAPHSPSDTDRETRRARPSRSERIDRSDRVARPSRPFRERNDQRNAERNGERVSRALQSERSERDAIVAPSLAPVPSRPIRKVGGVETGRTTARDSSKKKLKFYLNLGDQLEAAPSIGAKTAERFEAIGVITVDDFLKQTAESMATKLNYKRITASVIREWQHQARLVCRIPNLRGHDAQLLVGCDITEPETLATMQPQSLLNVILPFAESKEGVRIIRNGKKPDLEEINDWIAWAAEMRSIQAA